MPNKLVCNLRDKNPVSVLESPASDRSKNFSGARRNAAELKPASPFGGGPREIFSRVPRCETLMTAHLCHYGRGTGVGRGRTDGACLGVAVGRTVDVAVAVGVAVPAAVAVAVAVAVALGVADAAAVAVAVGVADAAAVAVAVAEGVGVGDLLLTAARISTRPQPYTLFGGPAPPGHWVEEIKCAELFKVSRLAVIWCRKLGMADHNRPMAPAMCGVAMDVPLAKVYAASPLLEHERVLVPGAVISGLMRLLPSLITGPRLLTEAMVSVPVFRAPAV